MKTSILIAKLHKAFLSEKTKEKIEKIILELAIASFIIHLVLVYLIKFKIIEIAQGTELLNHPIAAIYTPFSFILLYEVYLLIYYLPRSFTTYIGKQYEIIALIIIRRSFKDLSNLDIHGDWFATKYDLQFTYDLITSILIFALIFIFKTQNRIQTLQKTDERTSVALAKFIKIKKIVAVFLVPVFLGLTIYSFTTWVFSIISSVQNHNDSFYNINNIFFEQFFTILIFADVLILLFSFFVTDEFHRVFRNSGYIISTILIRISFTTTGITNNILILFAVVFGLSMALIHNKFEKTILAKQY